ncbi:MAG: hypothetical protein OEZ43_06990 [Gammaproteobacteria bacterium]|nr:hypothetical protein [Gammaproteobacteria bacterium]
MSTQHTHSATDQTPSHMQITDNGSIILGWLVIVVMLALGFLNIVSYEADTRTAANTVRPLTNEVQQTQPVSQPVQDKSDRHLSPSPNLMSTRLQI